MEDEVAAICTDCYAQLQYDGARCLRCEAWAIRSAARAVDAAEDRLDDLRRERAEGGHVSEERWWEAETEEARARAERNALRVRNYWGI